MFEQQIVGKLDLILVQHRKVRAELSVLNVILFAGLKLATLALGLEGDEDYPSIAERAGAEIQSIYDKEIRR